MLRLRPYKECDAKTIISWCSDEVSFRKWTSDRYSSFPITEYDMNQKYINFNGDCSEADNFYPMTAFDDDGIVGHLIIRYTNAEKTILRLGFVIVNDQKRGCGYGKEMLKLALRYSFNIFKAEKVTLGVFDNNMPAFYCYKAAGFKQIAAAKKEICNIGKEKWSISEMEINKNDFWDADAN